MLKKKVKVVVGYPPVESRKGVPLLSQNRQFQYFNAPTFIYPMVPAYAASLAQERGYEVHWMDGIAEGKKYDEWAKDLVILEPDFILIEMKAPIVRLFWEKVNDIKTRIPSIKVVLCGDHPTYDPAEQLDNCKVDYVITGGDYDFVFSDQTAARLENNNLFHPLLLASFCGCKLRPKIPVVVIRQANTWLMWFSLNLKVLTK